MKMPFVFEVSWEVANKFGGIYTVIKSKVPRAKQIFGERYLLIGPYVSQKLAGEFKEETTPQEFLHECQQLSGEGIRCHWGRWRVKGEPRVCLIDFSGLSRQANDIKRELWERYQIDSLFAPPDFTEPVVWAWAAGKVVARLSRSSHFQPALLHAHEWLAGSAVLYCAGYAPKIATVFTTHATFLGRSLAGSGRDIYQNISAIDPDKEVERLNIKAKFQTERASARHAHILTTVSHITARETEHFLGRKADVVTPNGLAFETRPTFEDISFKHRKARDRMREFLIPYFFPYYSFDLRSSLFFFISGRYEVYNKGIDVFIEALGIINKRLKKIARARTLVALLLIPAEVNQIDPRLVQAREIFRDLLQGLRDSQLDLMNNVLYNLISGGSINRETLFEEENYREIERIIDRLKSVSATKAPPLSTHQIANPDDFIMKALKRYGLNNLQEDKVKVIFYPLYLSGADGLLNLSYDEVVQGSHLGVFPSAYEPWGYTPLEAVAHGVPAITTDVTGFSQFIRPFIERQQSDFPGIFLLRRLARSKKEIIDDLSEIMFNYSRLARSERVQNKISALNLAMEADWHKLIVFYKEAYYAAINKIVQ